MTDAAAQAAMKRAIAIDAIADLEMQAADRIIQEVQAAAPGSCADSRSWRRGLAGSGECLHASGADRTDAAQSN